MEAHSCLIVSLLGEKHPSFSTSAMEAEDAGLDWRQAAKIMLVKLADQIVSDVLG